jgi:hypothetical protein
MRCFAHRFDFVSVNIVSMELAQPKSRKTEGAIVQFASVLREALGSDHTVNNSCVGTEAPFQG